MKLLERIRGLLTKEPVKPLSEWFFVTFDDQVVRIRAEPPGKEPWSQEFSWSSVVRVCFKAEDLYLSDGVYVFTSERPESYVVPTEADGGADLWSEIVRRELFDPELAIRAAQSGGGVYCWPPQESPPREDTGQAR